MESRSVTEYLCILQLLSVTSMESFCNLILYKINSQSGLSLLFAAVFNQSITVSGLEQKLVVYK